MNQAIKEAAEAVRSSIQNAVDAATAAGMIVTVSQVPLQPFAMGHHETIVEVRPALYMLPRD